MPTIRIEGFRQLLRGLKDGLQEYEAELKAEYRETINRFAQRIATDAASNLGRPNWKLSEAIAASRLKVYEGDGQYTLFQAVEPRNSLNPPPNTPAAYAFWQEHGWVVDLSKIKRARADRIMEVQAGRGRKRRTKAAYRKQAGKKFFKAAADRHFPLLQAEIEKIHERVKLKIANRP